MTAQEIIEKLKEVDNLEGFVYGSKTFELEVFGDSEIVDEVGDEEGGGEYSHVVRYFKDHDVYVKVIGCYSSYNGCDWEDEYIHVKPVEKLVTFYEA